MSPLPTTLVLASLLLPLLFPVLALWPGRTTLLRHGLPLLPLPALVLALWVAPGWRLEMPYLGQGSLWLIDELRRLFLLLTALLWTAAGLFAAGYLGPRKLHRFAVFWALTLTGNLGLVMSGDVISFYSFFALMTFAGYGLVVHEGTAGALWAGKVYLVMAVLGETALLAGLLLASFAADSLVLADLPEGIAASGQPNLVVGLLLAGFGVKAGLPLLHFWLPLAHPVAPTPASAVLSGAMIKAGLLGWLLTLPLGTAALTGWGSVMVLAGAVAALGAAAIGVCQVQPKAVLAYSSISQMGLITLMVGAALADPLRAPLLLPVIGLYALHHGLAKGSLFLSAGLSLPTRAGRRWLVWCLILLPGLALAGLPFTSGAVSKLAMKAALSAEALEFPLSRLLAPLMQAGAVATLLLMFRYFRVLRMDLHRGPASAMIWSGWSLAVLSSLVFFWWMPWSVEGVLAAGSWLPAWSDLGGLLSPMLLAGVLAAAALVLGWKLPAIPPGDGLAVLGAHAGRRHWRWPGWLRRWGLALAYGRAVIALRARQLQLKAGAFTDKQEQRLGTSIALMLTAIIVLMALM